MQKAVTFCLVVVGLINLAPVVGVLSAEKLSQAYGVEIHSPDLEILMRHRALLFGLLGGFILYAAFVPRYQSPAMVLAGLSMAGFAVLVWVVGEANPALRKILFIDLVGLAFLAVAVVARVLAGRS